jgi:hypothetical protein
MTKRSVSERFRQPIEEEIKNSTIRSKAWPLGVPIMLYTWEGKPYRSKHKDLRAVIVNYVYEIQITHLDGGKMRYERGGYEYKGLWIGEGFLSQDDMDTWFRDVVKKGETLMQYMMCFSLIK